MKNIYKIIITLLVLLVVGVIFVTLYFDKIGRDMVEDTEDTKKAILAINFECPEGSKESSQPWSKRGYSRFCMKDNARHGKWIAWEKEKLVIEGNYKEGKKDGRWTWYDDGGNIARVIEYRSDEVISDSMNDSK